MFMSKVAVLASISLSAGALAQTPRASVVIGGELARGAELGKPVKLIAAARRLIVLDAAEPHLLVFRSDGTLVQRIGRKGDGPGEFRAPGDMTYDAEQSILFVSDRVTQRVSTFQLGDSLKFVSALPLPLNAQTLCFAGKRLYAVALRGGYLVHEIQEVGGVLSVRRSFGKPALADPLADHPMFRAEFVTGPSACNSRAIAVGSTRLGAIHEINLAGDRQRVVRFPTFHGETVRAVDGGMSFRANADYTDYLRLILSGVDGSFTAVMTSTAVGGESSYTVRFDESRIDQPGPRGAWRPAATTPNDGTWCYRREPYPEIRLFTSLLCR